MSVEKVIVRAEVVAEAVVQEVRYIMIRHGHQRRKFNYCIYLRQLQGGEYIYLLLYVDDMLIACKSMGEIRKLKSQLSAEFEMKDMGVAQKILG